MTSHDQSLPIIIMTGILTGNLIHNHNYYLGHIYNKYLYGNIHTIVIIRHSYYHDIIHNYSNNNLIITNLWDDNHHHHHHHHNISRDLIWKKSGNHKKHGPISDPRHDPVDGHDARAPWRPQRGVLGHRSLWLHHCASVDWVQAPWKT